MKKRILSIVLTLCMVLALMPMTAFAETTTDGNFEYSVSEETNEVTITKYIGSGGAVEIPEKIDGIFVSIGRSPNSEMLDKSQLDEDGFIKVNKHFKVKTSYNNGYSKGLFAGGDVISKDVRQISTAISDGVIISQEVIKYLRRNIW